MAGRSQHRSQDQGQLEEPGPRIDRLAFIEWRDREGGRGTKDGDGLVAGVDTLFPGKARYAALIDSARAELNPTRPDAIAPLLARALGEVGAADSGQQAILEEALAAAAGVVIDGFADDGIVIPGERVQVETSLWNAGHAGRPLAGIELGRPVGWKVERLDATSSPVPTGTLATRRFAVTVAADAPRSQAYFLRRPLVGALYDWSGVPAAWRGLPFEPPPVQITVRLTIAGQPLTLSREVVYRYRDQGTGEVRRPLFVTRPFDVAVTPDLVVWPVDGTAGGLRHFTITVTNRTRGPAVARIATATPAGGGPPAPGVPIELLGPDTLARGDLSRYDAIVIGSRAYETEPALVASNGRLLDYARAGGLVIVQYQQYPFVNGGFAPYRLSIARPHDRVTDETAAVTVRDSASPAFHVPNEIGPDDWRGWVQERGLYFAHDWDPAYTPLVEMHDPGEPPLQGGLLVAAVGKGTYVYTGVSFFRQLPAGVPGAYRLFANLLALGKR